jgi:XTP/dITP diphosphohydrolase
MQKRGSIVVASRNQGKLAEYKRMFDQLEICLQSLDEAGVGDEVRLPEDGDTFVANALSKTKALHRITGGWALGDDSGLEVDALGGAPGVFSARYAGAKEASGRDQANLEKLLTELQGVPEPERTARFVCVIVLAGPQEEILTATGRCEGRIAFSPRGVSGFGYDPVFVPEGYERTMAELSMDEKNRISHRGRALAELVRMIRSQKQVLFSG